MGYLRTLVIEYNRALRRHDSFALLSREEEGSGRAKLRSTGPGVVVVVKGGSMTHPFFDGEASWDPLHACKLGILRVRLFFSRSIQSMVTVEYQKMEPVLKFLKRVQRSPLRSRRVHSFFHFPLCVPVTVFC